MSQKKRIHVRRGLKVIRGDEAADYSIDQYMVYVKDFYDKYFIKNPNKLSRVKRRVFLVTEEPNVLDKLNK